ncbi:SO_0444 family Cu/Zn efflux transporter [Methanococcoides sp. SA1]|nr:SO_0444 family Cu/Zn efflux transporter [Methanococcoides sp. SA1]
MTYVETIQELLIGIALSSWNVLAEAAPYLLLGFGVAGILHVFVPDEKIMQYLGHSAGKFRSVLNASLIGVPLPLCSCGVVPAALSLKKRGATNGATLSFLISTPQTGVDSIAITYALLDPIMTVFRPIATFITALVAGVAEDILRFPGDVSAKGVEKRPTKNLLEMTTLPTPSTSLSSSCGCNSCGPKGAEDTDTFSGRVISGIRYAYVELLGDISYWLIIGIILAGIITYMVPEDLVGSHLGGGLVSMLLALVVGIPLYICATASTPLAAVLIAKGMSPGAAFVFLLAGPATNAATITMVLKYLGKRSTGVYLASIAVCAVAGGILLDMVYSYLGIDALSVVGSASEVMPEEVKNGFALLLLPLMVYGIYNQKKGCD